MKQVEASPWGTIAEKYPVGITIEGKIKQMASFGLFVGIDDGIDALVHISNISWTKRIKLKTVRGDNSLKDTPVVMVTAETQKDNLIQAVKAGVSNYIVKPFTAETLKEKLKQTIYT